MESRRFFLKKLIIAGATPWFLPGDVFGFQEEKQMGAVVDAIVPGSKDLNVHLYVLRMINDCTEDKEKKAFFAGLAALDDYAKTSAGKVFADVPLQQRMLLLKNAPANLKPFATTARRMTIEGYTTTEYFMTKIIPYVPVPGSFKGCVKVVQS